MTEPLKIDPERAFVSWDGQSRPIQFTGTYPSEGYSDKPYIFLDDKEKEANGVLVEMQPKAVTKVLRVIAPNFRFQDIAISGSGWLLAINPEGEIVTLEVGPHLADKNPLVEFGSDWTFCWISGPQGLEILDVTVPPFVSSIEEEILKYSDQLPPSFWQQYDNLKQKT